MLDAKLAAGDFDKDAALEDVTDPALTDGQLEAIAVFAEFEAEDRHDRHIAGRDLEALPAFTPPAVEPTPEDVAAYDR